jgi:Class II flagellar assembly regulator
MELSDMKVSGPSGPNAAGSARPGRASSAAPGFEPLMTPSASGASGVTAAGGVARVNSLDALMALQEVGGPLERRRRAVGRASTILDALDDLKLELLEGGLSAAAIEALTRSVREQRGLTDDPRLEGVLDEIETRAAVELAKLEVARVAA